MYGREKGGEKKEEYKLSTIYQRTWKILYFPRHESTQLNCHPRSHRPPSSIVRSRDAKGRHFYRHKDAQSTSASVSVHLSISSVGCRHHYATFRLTEGVLAPLSTGGVNRPENTYTWRGMIPVVGRRRGGTILPLSSRTMKKILALFFDLVRVFSSSYYSSRTIKFHYWKIRREWYIYIYISKIRIFSHRFSRLRFKVNINFFFLTRARLFDKNDLYRADVMMFGVMIETSITLWRK